MRRTDRSGFFCNTSRVFRPNEPGPALLKHIDASTLFDQLGPDEPIRKSPSVRRLHYAHTHPGPGHSVSPRRPRPAGLPRPGTIAKPPPSPFPLIQRMVNPGTTESVPPNPGTPPRSRWCPRRPANSPSRSKRASRLTAAIPALKYAVIFGGVGQKPQTDALRAGVDILIATPGRLLDLMSQGYVHLKDLQYFVLDEADRMLDMGFIHDVRKVIAAIPPKRQTLFFSATMPEIQKALPPSSPTRLKWKSPPVVHRRNRAATGLLS